MNNQGTVLVTGGYGFIGSHFIRMLLESVDFKGRVVNFDALTYAADQTNLAEIEQSCGPSGRYVFFKGDISKEEDVASVFRDFTFSTVVNFAAETHVDRSINGPGDFVRTNVVGTANLLEAARKQKNPLRFHQVSTDEVYGQLGDEGLFREGDPYRPRSPYSASKAGADHLVSAYGETYGLNVSLTHCGNNYGPGQHKEKLIPLVVTRLLEGGTIPIYGDGSQVRDWIFVEDHVKGLLAVLTRGQPSGCYNLGAGQEMTNLNLVKKICLLTAEAVGKNPQEYLERIRFVQDRPGHDRRYALDTSKAEKDLGWTADTKLEQGLSKTVAWYVAKHGV